MPVIDEIATEADVREADVSRIEFPRHSLEGSELNLSGDFYPYGFPVTVRTNSDEVLRQYRAMWGKFAPRHATKPIPVEAQVVASSAEACPPAPSYRLMMPLMIATADADNYAIVDLERLEAKIVVTEAALRHPLYTQYFLLGVAMSSIATHHATPLHAGCVALHGRGVLLCGDSGAGKSTLSYACARDGWTYISDDACYLLGDGAGCWVTGNCHQARFRPPAADLFPELAGLAITPRAAGKPSIEVETDAMGHIERATDAHVDSIVFLNRTWSGAAELARGDVEAARRSMRSVLFGPWKSRAVQYQAIESLLATPVYELRYTKLEDALRLLREMAEGRP